MKGATIGMFDGVHAGHRYLLEQLKEHCDVPLAVTFDNHPQWVISGKHEPKLLISPEDKKELLLQMGVSPVTLHFDEELRTYTALQFIEMLRDRYGVERLVLGFDNHIGSDRSDASSDDILKSLTGVDIIRAPEFPGKTGINSSAIRRLIAAGDVALANRMLERPYTLRGVVGHGKELGRTIGFPTANVEPSDRDRLIPSTGVYAADAVTSDGVKYRAVVNIGNRPTVDGADSPVSIEAYLDGFDGNLYDTTLTLHFLSRLRDEQKFPDLDTLRQAITRDLISARSL